MKRLCLLFLLGSCSSDGIDRPADPALQEVRITYIHASPAWIRDRGFAMHLAKSDADRTLAFSRLRRTNKTCVITLPYPDSVSEALYLHLRRHEERHCHGEQHRDKLFRDEEPFG